MRGKAAGNPTKKRQTGPKPAKKAPEGPKQMAAAPTPAQEAQPPATEPATASPPPPGHNSGEMSPADRRFNLFRTRDKIIAIRAEVAELKSDERAEFKKSKAEDNWSKSEIEKAIKAKTPEGRLSMLADAQETKFALEPYPEGMQFSMDFGPQPPEPTIVTAAREGQLAFDDGEANTGGRWAPGSPENQAWIDAWNDKMARKVRGGIRPLQTGTSTTQMDLEAFIKTAPDTVAQEPAVGALDASLHALSEQIAGFIQAFEQGPLAEATAAVSGDPCGTMAPWEEDAAASEPNETMPTDPVETMPPEPGMPRAEWKDNMAAELSAEKQFIRHG